MITCSTTLFVLLSSLYSYCCVAHTPADANVDLEALGHRIKNFKAAAATVVAGGGPIRLKMWDNIPHDAAGSFADVSKGLGLFWTATERLTQTSPRYNDTAPEYESQCTKDFSKLLDSPSGQNIIDAIGKPPSNILNGNLQFLGSFDECFEAGGDIVKYCVVPTALVQYIGPLNKNPFVFYEGICVPQSCNGSDLLYYVNEINELIANVEPNYFFYPVVNSTICTDGKKLPFNAGAIVMITVCSLFAAMAILGTVVDLAIKLAHNIQSGKIPSSANTINEPETSTEKTPLLRQTCKSADIATPFKWERPLEFITVFSLFKNVSMILATKQPPAAITSLHGIRVISMFWVILGHTYVWPLSYSPHFSNPLYIVRHLPKRFSFQAVINAYFSVDSFFFLSGVLVAYLTLREMEKKKGFFPVITYYLHRYLRLTMVYAFCLFFWWFLTVHLANGNTWNSSVGPGSPSYEACNKYWWTNFLYINNFYPWKLNKECMGWTWYLANDMQFYIIAPIILIPLYHFFPVGLVITCVLLCGSFIATGWIAGDNKFAADILYQTPNATNQAYQNDQIYVKPYCRISPYLVGIVLGFVLYKRFRFAFHWFLNLAIYLCFWIVAAGCCFSALYGLYGDYHGDTLSLAENVSYYMFSRFTWGVGLACLVFACHNGYGWVVNDFLSMKFWIPLSRLTYTAYLVHPIVLTVMFGSMRNTFDYTDYILIIFAVAAVVLSFGAAGVIATFVEFPLSNLEMAVFKLLGLKLRESTRRVDSEKKEAQLYTPLPPDSFASGHEAKPGFESS